MVATITKRDGSPYVIYGDPAYGVSQMILAPYPGSQLTTQQVAFNRAMSHASVGGVDIWQNSLQFFLLRKQQSYVAANRKVLPGGSPADKLSYLLIWLTNIHSFGVDPPLLETYLANV